MIDDAALLEVLERARRLGFLGPGPVDEHVRRAEGFADALGADPDRVLDLGSGGGVPGLVLARRWPVARLTLLDASERRTAVLRDAVARLDVAERISVVRGRAEDVARDAAHRSAYDVVVARSFAPPAVTAEVGGAFLSVGGRLVVAEPPDDRPDRWPPGPLAELGLALDRPADALRVVVVRRVEAVEDRWPRRSGVPAKRPWWGAR